MPQRRCCILDCPSRKVTKGIKFFLFPASMRDRKEWMEFCRQPEDWQSLQYPCVCFRHFVDGKPTELHPIPTLERDGIDSREKSLKKKKKVKNLEHRKSKSRVFSKNLSTQFCYDATDPEPVGIEKNLVPTPVAAVSALEKKKRKYVKKSPPIESKIDKSIPSKSKKKNCSDYYGVDLLLQKWYKNRVDAKKSINFTLLKEQVHQFEGRCLVKSKDESWVDEWLHEWQRKNNVQLEESNGVDVIDEETPENVEEFAPRLDPVVETMFTKESNFPMVIESPGPSQETKAPDALPAISILGLSTDDDDGEEVADAVSSIQSRPSLSEAIDAFGVLRRFFETSRGPISDSLHRVEEELFRLAS